MQIRLGVILSVSIVSAFLFFVFVALYSEAQKQFNQSIQQTLVCVKALYEKLDRFDLDRTVCEGRHHPKPDKAQLLQQWWDDYGDLLDSQMMNYQLGREMDYRPVCQLVVAINCVRSKIQCQYQFDDGEDFPTVVADYVLLPHRLSSTIHPDPEHAVLLAMSEVLLEKVYYHLTIHIIGFLSEHLSIVDAAHVIGHGP